MSEPRPDRPDVDDALRTLSRIEKPTLPVVYAGMWLREARDAESAHDESRHLAKAEEQLSLALLASAAPVAELALAYQQTQRARSEATD